MAATDQLPALDSADALWEAADPQQQFWSANHQVFLKRYPDQFVAVKDGAVIANSPDLFRLVQILESKGVSPPQAWVRFVTTDPELFIL